MTINEYGSAEPVPGKCGSRLRKSEPPSYCQNAPAKDRTRCRLHGGSTPRGLAHPNYQGRGYTKDLPARLLERLVEGIDDPELTSLRTEIALLDARMGELVEGLDEIGATEAWASVLEQSGRLERLIQNPEVDGQEVVLAGIAKKLKDACDIEHTTRETWKEVYTLIDRRRRTTNVELKREENEELTMKHQQAMHFFAILIQVIKDEVPDKALQNRLSIAIATAMNREPPKQIGEVSSA